MNGTCRIFRAAFFLCVAAAACSVPGRAADAAPSDEVFTAEEKEIQLALRKEFDNMGPKGYILPGTRLYLYNPHRSKYYNVNSLGFRGAEPAPKKKNGFNIMVMGGSTVFGDTTKADFQTIPALLERLLRERRPDLDVNVYNLGFPGYEFQREIDLAKKFREQLKPDLVVFYNGGNNLFVAYWSGYPSIRVFEKEDETVMAKEIRGITNLHKQLWRFRNAVRRRVPFSDVKLRENRAEFVRGYLNDAVGIDRFFREKGVPVLFVLQPVVSSRRNKTARESQFRHLAAAGGPEVTEFYGKFIGEMKSSKEAADLMIYDFTDAFDRVDGEIYYDEIHVNTKGNQIIAERLADLVTEKALPGEKGRRP